MPCCVGLECLAGFAVGNVVNIGRLYSQWRKHFKNRPRRQNAESHFNSRTPDVHSAEDTYSSIRDAVIKRRGSLGAETTPEMIAPKDPAKKNRRVACPFVSTDPESGKPLWLADTRTKLLKFDELYIPFADFVRISYLYSVPLAFTSSYGIVSAMIRKKLNLGRRDFDIAERVGSMCLETTLATHYVETRYISTKEDEDSFWGSATACVFRPSLRGNHVASFAFVDIPVPSQKHDYELINLMTIDVDLESKKMLRAKIDGQIAPAEDVVVLLKLAFIIIHTKMHCLANWGTNESSPNTYIRKKAVVDIYMNYLGSSVPAIMRGTASILRATLLSDVEGVAKYLEALFRHGEEQGMRFHGAIYELTGHSRFVKFIAQLRNHFLNHFKDHKDDFAGIDGECFFLGSVVHGLDHPQMAKFSDPMMFNSARFSELSIVAFAVSAGLTHSDYLVTPRFNAKNAHPFFREVYSCACEIDQELADMMVTTMIQ